MEQQLELNNLTVNSFVCEFIRLPFLKFNIQSIRLPSSTVNSISRHTPFEQIMHSGDALEQNDFSITFIVDQRLNNYNTLYKWMRALTFPDAFHEFEEFVNQTYDFPITKSSNKRLAEFSDVVITFLSNHKVPIFKYKFSDCFPSELDGFELDITVTDPEPITVNCDFKFTGMTIEPIL